MTHDIPFNEAARLAELHDMQVLDSRPEQGYDDIVLLASAICRVPIAAVSFIDERRQWFKSIKGFGISEVPREISLCRYTLMQPERLLEVPDTLLDSRFKAHPIVVGEPNVRLYISAPIISSQGHALGTVCIMDAAPRQVTDEEREALRCLSRQVTTQLELRRAVQGLKKEGMTDFLTNVWNRRAFDIRLADQWNLQLYNGQPLSVLIVDVDHFKQVNDVHGHPVGDTVLRSVAEAIAGAVRREDMVARYGGEEFAVILPNADEAAACAVAEKVRAAIEAAPLPIPPVTASVGVAGITPAGTSQAGPLLVAHADRALYEAKRRGRNRVVAYGAV